MDLQTHFAKPERSSQDELKSDHDFLESEKMFLDIFGSFSGIAAIINNNRQIVYGNFGLLELFGIDSLEPILGKRLGEAVSCKHANENFAGCGTSESCSVCGAVNSIITSQETGQKSVRETRISSVIDEKNVSWDLKVSSSPLIIRGRQYYIFTIQDISIEKRMENLERIFFHDLLNSAGSLNGLLSILKDGTDPEQERELIELSVQVSRDIIEEIVMHRQLRAAENGDLILDIQTWNASELLKTVVSKMEGHSIAKGKRIIVLDVSSGVNIETDRKLVERVLVNLIRNALEATDAEGIVLAKVQDYADKIRFEVKNDLVMSKEIQLQVFNRSFSTKGIGRGTGTYSIKLITENYLGGKAGFTSSEREGTVFYVEFNKNLKKLI
jgi:K+-sensing histidine kinase KdpD